MELGITKKHYHQTHKEEKKQYLQTHKEKTKQYNKQYKKTHKEPIAVQKKQYQQTHKNIRKCSCGVEYNDGKSSHRDRHYRSHHHIDFVNDFYDRLHSLLVPVE